MIALVYGRTTLSGEDCPLYTDSINSENKEVFIRKKGIWRIMKKAGRICLILILSLLFALPASADVQSGRKPDYRTDYYMIVESKAGGIDIYAQPDLESSKLNEGLIPNGTALHIEGEVEDKNNQRTWGYVKYHGMNGYVPLDDCRPAQSRQEAIDSELYIAGKDNVNYDADYDVTAYAEDGSQKLYQGPGEKYGVVPGSREIENGEILHITQDAELVDGSRWGVTTSDGKEGWIDLDKTADGAESKTTQTPEEKDKAKSSSVPETDGELKETEEPGAAETSEGIEETKAAAPEEGEEAPELNYTSEGTKELGVAATSEGTKEPGVAATSEGIEETKAAAPKEGEEKSELSSPEEGEEMPELNSASEETEEPGAVAASKESETPEATSALENSGREEETEAAEDVSGQDVTADTTPISYQPIIWIALVGVAAVIIILICHFRKR